MFESRVKITKKNPHWKCVKIIKSINKNYITQLPITANNDFGHNDRMHAWMWCSKYIYRRLPIESILNSTNSIHIVFYLFIAFSSFSVCFFGFGLSPFIHSIASCWLTSSSFKYTNHPIFLQFPFSSTFFFWRPCALRNFSLFCPNCFSIAPVTILFTHLTLMVLGIHKFFKFFIYPILSSDTSHPSQHLHPVYVVLTVAPACLLPVHSIRTVKLALLWIFCKNPLPNLNWIEL